MIEQLSTQCADESLDHWILPRASISDANFLDAAVIEESSHAVAIEVVIIPVQVSRLDTPRGRLSQLLNDPVHTRMSGRRPVNHPSSSMVEYDEHIEC